MKNNKKTPKKTPMSDEDRLLVKQWTVFFLSEMKAVGVKYKDIADVLGVKPRTLSGWNDTYGQDSDDFDELSLEKLEEVLSENNVTIKDVKIPTKNKFIKLGLMKLQLTNANPLMLGNLSSGAIAKSLVFPAMGLSLIGGLFNAVVNEASNKKGDPIKKLEKEGSKMSWDEILLFLDGTIPR
ncbi:MAG: hypothetical protein KC478_10320 [Bacteriovoracaceae bacterium]|nr:hypothetical protein [Bacteriovoracaceae bacterium]